MSAMQIGSVVRHPRMPEWGSGRVMCVSDRYVLVGFPDRPPENRFTRFDRSTSDLEVVPDPGDPRFIGLHVDVDSLCKQTHPVRTGRKGLPVTLVAEMSVEQAYQLFLAKYPDGFSGDAYLSAERNWKWEKHEEWLTHFSGTALRDGAANDPVETAKRVMHVVQTTVAPLLDPRSEIPVLTQALEEPEPTRHYLEALADLLEAGPLSAEPFNNLVEALTALPSKRKTGRLASWAVLTVVPFLADPEHFMFMKPVPTKTFARQIGFDLLYSPGLKWDAYRRLLRMSDELASHLRPFGARDYIDVQSFMWIIAK